MSPPGQKCLRHGGTEDVARADQEDVNWQHATSDAAPGSGDERATERLDQEGKASGFRLNCVAPGLKSSSVLQAPSGELAEIIGSVPVDGEAGTGLRAGTDLVEIAQVTDSIARFGERYLRRIFTDHEIDSCRGEPPVVAAGLAARFAAKEATVKVLRPGGAGPDWRSIEVVRHPAGWCDLHLTGEARRLADEAGISKLALSMSHEAGVAGAVVVALCSAD